MRSRTEILDQIDLSQFHQCYGKPTLTSKEAVESYLLHVGFRRYHILKMVREKVQASFEGHDPLEPSVFDRFWRLSNELLASELKCSEEYYYEPSSPDDEEKTVLAPEEPNDLIDPSFPAHLQFCTARSIRQEFSIITTRQPARLFCSSAMYQVYDADAARFFPTASPFSLTKSISYKRAIQTDRDLIFVGDIFGGSNFSHFLFDHVTRIARFLESGRNIGRKPLFVANATTGDFQKIVMTSLMGLFSLSAEDFFFPELSVNLESTGRVSWFSDSFEFNQHPAQLMAPRSVEALQAICRNIATADGTLAKIYISRSDAKHRRIVNEVELVDALRLQGFVDVTLTTFSVVEQISLIRSAKIIVAPHGMALTLCAFNRGPLKIVELFSSSDASGTDAYAAMSRMFNFDYHYTIGTAVDSDFYVRVDEVLSRL